MSTELDEGHVCTPSGSTCTFSCYIREMIEEECDSIKQLLLTKNKRYGNSALWPLRIFSHADTIAQLDVRIDDKLSRIAATGAQAADEDTLRDLIGYLILRCVAMRQHVEE